MEAFELRLWDGRIGRWLTVDPYHEFYSPYVGMGNNPMNLIDPDGGSTTDPVKFPENPTNGQNFTSPDGGNWTYKNGSWEGQGFNTMQFQEIVMTGITSDTKLQLASNVTNVLSIAGGAIGDLSDLDKMHEALNRKEFFTENLNSNRGPRYYRLDDAGKPKYYGNQYNSREEVLKAAKDFKFKAGTLRAVRFIGNGAGLAGTIITTIDIGNNGYTHEKGLDGVIGIMGFIPGYGWAIAGTYTIAKPVTKELVRQWDEHVTRNVLHKIPITGGQVFSNWYRTIGR